MFRSSDSMLLGAGLGGLLISWSGNVMKLNFILDGSLHIMCALIVLLLSYLTKRHPHMARKEELSTFITCLLYRKNYTNVEF
jgi:hypothetical protein